MIRLAVLLLPILTLALQQQPLEIANADGRRLSIEDLASELSAKRVVFIGENHERYDHHLAQLEIVRALRAKGPQHWAVGLEFFERSQQEKLDAYVRGDLSERELLESTGYFERWGYDYRLYRPILQYAREQRIPLLGLNAEKELVEKVSDAGLAGLTAAERLRVPADIDKSDASYRERMRALFSEHDDVSQNFEHFWETQLVWDETMADTAARYLREHPVAGLVVLVGSGHLEYGVGIPARVKRRLPGIASANIIATDEKNPGADYVMRSAKKSLEPTGKLGVAMDLTNGVGIKTLPAASAAAKAGLQVGDQIRAVDSQAIRSLTDYRLAFLDKRPGQRVAVNVTRPTGDGSTTLTAEVTLQE